jgi:hypothetical protein
MTNSLNEDIAMETNELIERLAHRTNPVRRLPAPWRRVALWLSVSLAYGGVVVAALLIKNGLPGAIDLRLVVEQVAILATAVLAAFAAFSSTVPGRDRRIGLLPLIPFTIWLASLGTSCLNDWLRLGADGLAVRPDWECAPAGLLLSVVPAAAMVAMLRRGVPLTPRFTLALGALASAALVNFGLRIFHAGDISVMVLAWHFGALAILAALGGQFGRVVLNWRVLAARSGVVAVG